MTTVSFSTLRTNLAHFLTMVEDDCEELVVTRGKGRASVIVSLSEYLSIQETAYLLSSPKNRKHLERSLKELREGKTIKVSV